MEKPAPVTYPLHDVLRKRWSPRAFSSRLVPKTELLSLLEAARWAPSSYGEEPWRYLIATRETPEDYQTMLQCLVEKNQKWAQSAPVLMIGCTRKAFTRLKKPNPHAWHDLGQATAQLTVEAVARGLFVHQMAGIQPDKIRTTYQVPEEFDIATGIAIGYPGELAALPEEFHESEKAPRQRRPPQEIFFSHRWGQPAL